jgi:2-oxoglutarate dehydrogenase E2 component (dihydrolipoamide succinyltransferase)
MVEVKVPTVGESIQEVQIGQWLKGEGEWIAKDENLVDLETEKASVQVPSPVAGIVRNIRKRTEEFAGIGETIADIEPSEAPAQSSSQSAASAQRAFSERCSRHRTGRTHSQRGCATSGRCQAGQRTEEADRRTPSS